MTSPHDDEPQPIWTAPGSATPASPPAGQPPAPPTAPLDLSKPAPHAGWNGQPAWNGQPGWGAPPPAWRPPALQPGIIPLRPLSLGEILDGAFRAIRANPRVMFGLSALVVTIAVLIQSVLTWYAFGLISDALADVVIDDSNPFTTGQDVGTFAAPLSQLISAPITSLVTTILTGWLIVSVSRSVLGQKVRPGEVLRNKRIWLVLGFTVLLAVVTVVVSALLVGAVWMFAAMDSPGLAVLVGVVGGLVLLVAAIFVAVRTLLVTPALMLEGKGFRSTVGRAWRLTKGSFWRLFGIYLLVSILVNIVSQIIVTPAALVSAIVFSDPDGQAFASVVVLGVANIIALTLTTTYLASVVALLYVDVRMRREGLDVELARAAQQAA